jgi:hypothetical protein
VINTKVMREKYASNNGRAPAGAVDVRALATVCRNCRVIGSKWEAAT